MVVFIAAVYNEEYEIDSLVEHVWPYVDGLYIVDDQSTDRTVQYLGSFMDSKMHWQQIPHTGLPETVKNAALHMVPDGSWVLMLDADERFKTPISEIIEWIKSPASQKFDYVYFEQYEIIDGQHVRTFQKCKLFRKESITFSTGIHEDDKFKGTGLYCGWEVYHRKSSEKQKQREKEYLVTYQNLLDTGQIDEGRHAWLKALHHYEKG